MVTHERLTEPRVIMKWLLAKPRSFSNLPAFHDLNCVQIFTFKVFNQITFIGFRSFEIKGFLKLSFSLSALKTSCNIWKDQWPLWKICVYYKYNFIHYLSLLEMLYYMYVLDQLTDLNDFFSQGRKPQPRNTVIFNKANF